MLLRVWREMSVYLKVLVTLRSPRAESSGRVTSDRVRALIYRLSILRLLGICLTNAWLNAVPRVSIGVLVMKLVSRVIVLPGSGVVVILRLATPASVRTPPGTGTLGPMNAWNALMILCLCK